MNFVLNIVVFLECGVGILSMRIFSRRQSFREAFFLYSKFRDKEALKIKILRNPEILTQNKTSNSAVFITLLETKKIIAYHLKICTDQYSNMKHEPKQIIHNMNIVNISNFFWKVLSVTDPYFINYHYPW